MFETAFIAFLVLLVIYVVLLLIFRFQDRRQRRQLGNLTVGDNVVMQGGLIGEVRGVGKEEIVLQVAEGVEVRVLRSAVTGLRKVSSVNVVPARSSSAGTQTTSDFDSQED